MIGFIFLSVRKPCHLPCHFLNQYPKLVLSVSLRRNVSSHSSLPAASFDFLEMYRAMIWNWWNWHIWNGISGKTLFAIGYDPTDIPTIIKELLYTLSIEIIRRVFHFIPEEVLLKTCRTKDHETELLEVCGIVDYCVFCRSRKVFFHVSSSKYPVAHG